jgi:hypothetical protein
MFCDTLVAIASRFGDFLVDIIRQWRKEFPMTYVESRRSEKLLILAAPFSAFSGSL